jgi:hypothetical protein
MWSGGLFHHDIAGLDMFSRLEGRFLGQGEAWT